MRREIASAGLWLAGTAVAVGLFGYLIATVAAGGRHPIWPYFLFGAVAAVGFGMYITGRRHREADDSGDMVKRRSELGSLLLATATGWGLTEKDVRTRVHGPWSADDVDLYLDGKLRPDWAFIDAFAQAVAGKERFRTEALLRQIRPAWQAAEAAPASAAAHKSQHARLTTITAGVAAASRPRSYCS
jgi:hypothetical protein